MEANYIYNVGLYPGASAGNHFHKNKKEIFYCPIGQKVEIVLENPKTGIREVIKVANMISDYNSILVYVKLGIVHTVINKSSWITRLINKIFRSVGVSSIMVFSNVPELDERDDYPPPNHII